MSKNRNWPDFRRKWNLTIRIFGFYRLMSKYARYSASEAPPKSKRFPAVNCITFSTSEKNKNSHAAGSAG